MVNGSAMGSSANPGWLTLRISGGGLTVNSGTKAYFFVVAPSGTVTLNGNLTGGVTAQGLTVQSNVTLQLVPSTPPPVPTVALTAPGAGSVYASPATIALSANATETGGSIASVKFYAGAQLVGTSTVAPFQYTWSNAPAGNYSLTAVATDALGAMATSVRGSGLDPVEPPLRD